MLKVAFFQGEDERGAHALPLFGPADSVFEKTAAPLLLPEVSRYISSLRPRPDAQYVLLNAMGAGEFWGSNINGDHFPEAALIHKPNEWTGNPLLDKEKAKDWPYGFPTFYFAHPYAHHRNKDATRAFGEVELAAWNPHMKRVELVARVDEDKCQKFGGVGVWDKLKAGEYPDVSMGCKVPYDTCSICLDWDTYRKAQAMFRPGKDKTPGEAVLRYHKEHIKKNGKGIRGVSITRADYCEHAKKDMNKILPDGRKVFVYNDYPKFFDISFVFIGADKTAKVMMKVASSGKVWSMPSAELAEKLGYAESVFSSSPDKEWGKGATRYDIHQDGKNVASAIVRPNPRTELGGMTLSDLLVHPEHREQGLGRQLLQHVLGRHGGTDLYLRPQPYKDSPMTEEALRTFYGKEGFKAHGKELMKYSPDVAEKTASVLDDELKLAFLGKQAKDKDAEITKDVVPSQFAGKAVPVLTKSEKDLPKDVLDMLGASPLEEALSTSAGLGMVLRPREFQRIVLIHIGKRPLAEKLESEGKVFPKTDEKLDVPMGPGFFSHLLASLLSPFMSKRSALGPHIESRVLVASTAPKEAPKEKRGESSSHSSELLRKMSAAYNVYREGVMDIVAHAQDLVASLPPEEHLRKVAGASTHEVFTPLSVRYLKLAYWDEVPSDTDATVEKGLPSRNTSAQKTAGGIS